MIRLFAFVLIILLASVEFSCRLSLSDKDSDARYLFVGTYTDQGSDGIYRYSYDHETGAMSEKVLVAKVSNPSYITINKDMLFAVSEEYEGAKLSSYFINEEGLLDSVSSAHISGSHPCYVEYSPDLGLVMVANYTSGSISAFKVDNDGNIDTSENLIQQQGFGPNLERQEGPHTHSVVISPNGKVLYSANLGSDRVYLYDMKKNLLPISEIEVASGSGPRHMAFHPDLKIMALVNELSNTVILFEKDKNGEYINEIQTISTLPDDFSDFSKAADIHFSKDGRFLYVSNRGHNSIVCYSFDEIRKKLTPMEWISTGGETPRNFLIEGNFLIVANQDSDNIVVFKIKENGFLELAQVEDGISKPVCIKSY